MALFEVKGWNIKNTKVAEDSGPSNRQKKKEKREKRKRARQEDDEEEGRAVYDSEEEQPQEDRKKAKKQKKDKKDKPRRRDDAPELKKEPEPESEPETPAPAPVKLTPLQQKMMEKLSGSRFRWINEQLYTITSNDALSLIEKQPELFDEYHSGFRSQVKSWPENPVNVFVDQIKARAFKPVNAPGGLPGLENKQVVVADMGCGEAQLAQDVDKFVSRQKGKRRTNIKVHSFDLKKQNKFITVADIKNVPMADESCTIVVFSLALMGTNFLDFIEEAYRILAPRGELWIAEIKSRFADDKGDEFVNALKLLGFFHKNTDDSNKMFTRFEFFKPAQDIIDQRKEKLQRQKKFIEQETQKEELEKKREKRPEGEWLLKPCIYKRR
ncbi:25S rRNA (adenine(645)-N(1))-methyltransferase [Diutina catenulata]